jgi:hypothetical protein
MMDLNVMSAMVAAVMLAMVAVGYFPLFWSRLSGWVAWVFLGVVVLSVTTFLRQGYWDLFRFFAGDHWALVRDGLGGQQISTVFNLGVIASCFCFLKGRLYLIPRADRANWTWASAWLHPCYKCRFWRPRGR